MHHERLKDIEAYAKDPSYAIPIVARASLLELVAAYRRLQEFSNSQERAMQMMEWGIL